jgi:glyoxylate utilization-related uncharacterized protein
MTAQPVVLGPGPAPHIHRSYVEEWLLTEGTVQFVLGGARHRVDAGSFAFVPHGVAHAFSDPGPGRARILAIGSARRPPRRQWWRRPGAPIKGHPDPKAVAEAYERFDSELRHRLHPDEAAAVAARTANARPHTAAPGLLHTSVT